MKYFAIILLIIVLFVLWTNRTIKLHPNIAYYPQEGSLSMLSKVSGQLDFSNGCASIRTESGSLHLLIFPNSTRILEQDNNIWKFNEKVFKEGEVVVFGGGFRLTKNIDLLKVNIPNKGCITDYVAIIGQV